MHTDPTPLDIGRKPVVLHVTECFEGGVSRAIRSLVESAPDFEHRLLARGAEVDEERASGTFAAIESLGRSHLRRVIQVHRATRDHAVAVVHAHSSWAGVYTRLTPLPAAIVYQPHGYAFEMAGRLKQIAYFLAEKMLTRRHQVIAVLSPREADLARRVHNSARRVLVPNVPSTARSTRIRESIPLRVAMIGRLCPQKDPGYFADLVAEVRRQQPEIEAVWIGSGPEDDRSELRDAGISVSGWLRGAELEQQLDDIGVYVHTAAYEGFPLSVLDVASRRVGVVARAIPCFNGTPVLQAATVQEHAALVLKALDDPSYERDLVQRSARLLEMMNEASQRRALLELYSAASPSAVIA